VKKNQLIAYACGAGAKNDGCRDAPLTLKELGMADALSAAWVKFYESPTKNTAPLVTVADYCDKLCSSIMTVIAEERFPIAVGGDHSMAIGMWSGVTNALKAKLEFGLIWFDAHMDSHTPKTSVSGFYHGMPLACLLGHGDGLLCSIGGYGPKLNPEHVCLIGVRSYEEGEARFLKEQGVHIFYMEEVVSRGLKAVINDALLIAKKARGGYGVTIDIDAFDPNDAPGTGAREPGGLNGAESIEAFKVFAGDDELKAIEVAEYNPHLDSEGKTSRLIFDLLVAMLTQRD
jgi:arginase